MIKLGSTRIINGLEQAGCEWAFGIPGGPMSSVFHSLVNSKKIRTVITQHESAAGFMAIGSYLFSRERRIPVVFATAGPGAVNAMAGITAAWEEKVPLLFLTANVSSLNKGRRAAQDSFETGIDICKMFEPITSRTIVLDAIDDVEKVILGLYRQSQQSSMPVHLNLPGNISMKLLSPNEFPETKGFENYETRPSF